MEKQICLTLVVKRFVAVKLSGNVHLPSRLKGDSVPFWPHDVAITLYCRYVGTHSNLDTPVVKGGDMPFFCIPDV